MSDENNAIRIRLQKFWQTEEGTLFWQINPFDGKNKSRYPKKAYLILTTSPKPQLKFSLQKPERVKPSGQFVSLLRKYMPGGNLAKVWIGKGKSSSRVLEIMSGGKVSYITLDDLRPPMISLLTSDPLTNVCRMTPKSCYTKRSDASPPDLSEFTEVPFSELLKSLEISSDDPSGETEESPTDENDEMLSTNDFSKYQKESIKRLKRRFKTIKKSLDKARKSVVTAEDIRMAGEKAKLLQTYAYLVSEEDLVLRLDPSQTGSESMTIELDPDISVGENIERHFIAAKKLKRSSEVSSKQLKKLLKEYDLLQEAIQRLSNDEVSDSEIEQYLNKFGISLVKQDSSAKDKNTSSANSFFRRYETEQGFVYFVGKGPKENDLLTKSAKSNDYWVHTSEVSGSHVIIPAKTIKDGKLSPTQIKHAGILAIHFSKLREGKAGEVYLTKKHNIKKKKGLAPGLWIVEKSETIFIRYAEKEMRELLNCLKP